MQVKNACSCNSIDSNVDETNIKNNLIWLDLEMTGLDVDKDRILEIAVIVTRFEKDLQNNKVEIKIIDSFTSPIKQSKEVLDNMDEWNTCQHNKSNLVNEVLSCPCTCTEQNVEAQALCFVEKHTQKGSSPLCGSSVFLDKLFIKKYMPNLHNHFSYRVIDVSSIREIGMRLGLLPEKQSCKNSSDSDYKSKHRALSDIQDSIKLLEYYINNIFKRPF